MVTTKKFLAAILILSATLSSSQATAESVAQMVNEAVKEYFNDDRLRKEYESGITLNADGSYTLNHGGMSMRFIMSRKGKPDNNGKYPLYIALHGGGGAPHEENDSQWREMFTYYKGSVNNGIYIACRGISDTWDLHFQDNSYPLYDRLIQSMIYSHNADPNRVYLLGFSAGGDGVYQILPRMADRFAAGNMSSGHPNGVSLVNLANCPISIQAGIRDYYSVTALRSVRAAEFDGILTDYRKRYGFGYEHRVLIHVPAGHNFMDNTHTQNHTSLKHPQNLRQMAEECLTISFRCLVITAEVITKK